MNGNWNGEGIEYYRNGEIKYEGKFINGKWNGYGTEYYENGEFKREGNFSNGEWKEEKDEEEYD